MGSAFADPQFLSVNGQAEKKRVKKRSIDSGSKKMSTREKKEKEELDQSCKIKVNFFEMLYGQFYGRSFLILFGQRENFCIC